nr:hypothetical protein [Kibdelosporangium sp. MJ126-NF4]
MCGELHSGFISVPRVPAATVGDAIADALPSLLHTRLSRCVNTGWVVRMVNR